jgi:uncharacterized protein YecT (DUF1311 family)
MIRSLVLAIPLVLLAAPALAGDADGVDCKNALTQFAMDVCAGRDFDAADEKLNVVYAKALAAQFDDATREKFKATERAWIKFRDAQCDHAAATFEGGSMQPQVHLECLTRLTNARVKELQDYLACEQANGVCE